MQKAINLIDKLVNLLYPRRVECVNCQQELVGFEVELGLCSTCLEGLYLIAEDHYTGKRSFLAGEKFFDLGFSAILYEGLIKDLIYRFKYYGERRLMYSLVEIMYKQMPIILQKIKWDGLIPVPMHSERLKQRGFNQALLLAEGLAFYLNLSCCDWVVRVTATEPQNKLGLEERHQNLEGVFGLKHNQQIKGGKWLIIDDILTTGTTVNQVARVLRAEGANFIGIYTLASGSLDAFL